MRNANRESGGRVISKQKPGTKGCVMRIPPGSGKGCIFTPIKGMPLMG